MDDVIELDDQSWKKTVENGDKPVFVMFYSVGCPNCETMKPHFAEYAKDFRNRVVFAKINIHDNLKTARKYGVLGVPTFKFFCGGHPVQEIVGAVYPYLLKKSVEDAFKHGPQCVTNTTWIDPCCYRLFID